MRISIFGLGYVGTVASACIAESGHEVIAIDTDPVKVKCLREGRSPIVEPGLDEMISKNVAAGRLKTTMDVGEAVMNSDLSLICVGTPSNPDGSLKLDYVREVCRQIGVALREKDGWHSVVLRSTVVPGTARDIAIPVLEEASEKEAGKDFGFGNNPEFLRESTAIHDYFNPPKIVIGALDKKTVKAVTNLYHGIEAPRVVTAIEVAEGVKYADNAWHALKVGFANEIGNIMKEHGVDSHMVMDIFCLDTKLNISTNYLKPGFAFGGSCLPKDVRALRASAKQKGLKTPIFDSLLEANDEQVRRAHRMVLATGKKKVALLGLGFKAGTDDLRESPLVTLADLLLGAGIDVAIYDPHVSRAANMDGANKGYLLESVPHLSSRLVTCPNALLENAEVLVIGNHGDDFGQIVAQTNDNTPIIDLVRLKGAPQQGRKAYSGICW